jgi:hypothetical protein
MIVHAWFMAKCRACAKWVYLDYAGPMEVGRLGLFAEPLPMPGKCSECGHEDTYGGAEIHQLSGPDPHATKPER